MKSAPVVELWEHFPGKSSLDGFTGRFHWKIPSAKELENEELMCDNVSQAKVAKETKNWAIYERTSAMKRLSENVGITERKRT